MKYTIPVLVVLATSSIILFQNCGPRSTVGFTLGESASSSDEGSAATQPNPVAAGVPIFKYEVGQANHPKHTVIVYEDGVFQYTSPSINQSEAIFSAPKSWIEHVKHHVEGARPYLLQKPSLENACTGEEVSNVPSEKSVVSVYSKGAYLPLVRFDSCISEYWYDRNANTGNHVSPEALRQMLQAVSSKSIFNLTAEFLQKHSKSELTKVYPPGTELIRLTEVRLGHTGTVYQNGVFQRIGTAPVSIKLSEFMIKVLSFYAASYSPKPLVIASPIPAGSEPPPPDANHLVKKLEVFSISGQPIELMRITQTTATGGLGFAYEGGVSSGNSRPYLSEFMTYLNHTGISDRVH